MSLLLALLSGSPVIRGLQYFNGSVWAEKPLKYWTGSEWLQKPVKYWNGSSWI